MTWATEEAYLVCLVSVKHLSGRLYSNIWSSYSTHMLKLLISSLRLTLNLNVGLPLLHYTILHILHTQKIPNSLNKKSWNNWWTDPQVDWQKRFSCTNKDIQFCLLKCEFSVVSVKMEIKWISRRWYRVSLGQCLQAGQTMDYWFGWLEDWKDNKVNDNQSNPKQHIWNILAWWSCDSHVTHFQNGGGTCQHKRRKQLLSKSLYFHIKGKLLMLS